MSTSRSATKPLRANSPETPRFPGARSSGLQLGALALGAALVGAVALPVDLVFALAAENGPLETLQALLLFALSAGVFFLSRREEGVPTSGSVAFLLFAMGARELEWHKAWIGGNVLKPRFYLGLASPATKLLAAVLVVLLALSAVYLIGRHGREAWRALRRREPLAITAAAFFGALVLSRIADKTHLGHPLSRIVAGTLIVEEMLELALPLLVLLGAYQYTAARADVPVTAPDSPLLTPTFPVGEGS